jgi:nucleoid DNA-binding protein
MVKIAELITEYATRLGIPPEDAKFLLDECFASVVYILNKQGVVNVRKFGMFTLRVRKRAKMFNNFKKQWIVVPLRYSAKFKPTGYLKNVINGKAKDNMFNAYKFMEG